MHRIQSHKFYTILRSTSVAALLTLTSACMSTPVEYLSNNVQKVTDSFLRPAALPLDNAVQPITLETAQIRTLSHNSEFARQERRFVSDVKKSGRKAKDYLPQIYLNAFGQWRNNTNAAVGEKVNSQDTNTVSNSQKDFYTGQDQVFGVSNLTATWDILEIGMSGLKANRRTISAFKQGEQNQYLCHKLMVDVEHAYWKAVAYEQAAKRSVWLKSRIEYALELSQSNIDKKPDDKLGELMFQRELIDINRWYESIFRGLTSAKADLARLMNLPLGTEFTLSETQIPQHLGETTGSDVNTLIKLAYQNRPEIRQALYSHDLVKLGNKEAIINHLPALRLFLGANMDSNSFLLNQNFASAGLNLSWDILRLGQIGQTKRRGRNRLLDRRYETEVLASAIMAQVMIAREQVQQLDHDLSLALKALKVQTQITDALQDSVKTENKSETYLVKEELMRELVTLRENLARAEFFTAKARLDQSIGIVDKCSTPNRSQRKQIVKNKETKLTLRPKKA